MSLLREEFEMNAEQHDGSSDDDAHDELNPERAAMFQPADAVRGRVPRDVVQHEVRYALPGDERRDDRVEDEVVAHFCTF